MLKAKINYSNESIILDKRKFKFSYFHKNKLEMNCQEISKKLKLRTDHLDNTEIKELNKILKEFDDLITDDDKNLTFTNVIKHKIRTTDETPVYQRSYKYPVVYKEEVNKQINKLLNQDIIRHSYSPWCSPIWIVPKKQDASGETKFRMVIDYRKLNSKTIDDKFPIPDTADILNQLGKCTYFSTIDLKSGFHQIEMDSDSIEKTAFSTDQGHFEFLRMPFGLKNAPSTFQRLMNFVLKDLINKICFVYLDDIIILGKSLQEHIQNIKIVFQRLREANLKLQLDKSEFLRKEFAYLGHIITTEGIKPNPDKIETIKKLTLPKNQKEIKSFLGFLGYYRRFIKDFSKLTKPFTKCLKKDAKININNKGYISCFEKCKLPLSNAPILQYPDFSKQLRLTTDASNFALGAVLSQNIDGKDLPIAYASRTLNDHEVNYSTTEKELFAIVWATKHFHHYVYGRKFKLITDHKPLIWLNSLKEPNSKLIRWKLKLSQYNYDIEYQKGKQNYVANYLSRFPKPFEIN